MPKTLRLPDGTEFDYPDNVDESRAREAARRAYPEAFASEQKAPPKEGFIPSVFEGARSMASNLGIGALAGLGKEDLARKMSAADDRRKAEEYKSTSYDDVEKAFSDVGMWGKDDKKGGISSLISYWRDQLGQSIPQMAGYMGAAKAGSMLGGRLGAIGGLPGAAAGTVAGGALGAGAFGLSQFFGSNLERQLEEQRNAGIESPLDKGTAAMAAVPQAALDVGATALALRGFGFGKQLTEGAGRALKNMGFSDTLVARLTGVQTSEAAEKVLRDAAQRSLLASAGRGMAAGAAFEMPTEVAQQVLERWQAGLDLLDSNAWKEYRASAVGAAGIGGAMGGVGGVYGRQRAANAVDDLDRQRDIAKFAAAQAEEAERKKQEAAAMAGKGALPDELEGGGTQGRLLEGPAEALPGRDAGVFDAQAEEALRTAIAEAEGMGDTYKASALRDDYARRMEVRKQEQDAAAQAAADKAAQETRFPTSDPARMRQILQEQKDELLEQRTKALEALDVEASKRIGERLKGVDAQLEALPPTEGAVRAELKKLEDTYAKLSNPQHKQYDPTKAEALAPKLKDLRGKVASYSQPVQEQSPQADLFEVARTQDTAEAARAAQVDAAAQQREAMDADAAARADAVEKSDAEQYAAEEERRAAEAADLAKVNAPLRRQVPPTKETAPVVGGRVVGSTYSYPAGQEGADAPGAVPPTPEKVAPPRFQQLLDAVDEGKITPELSRAMGLGLSGEVDLGTQQGAVAALPALEARAAYVKGLVEKAGTDKLAPPQQRTVERLSSLLTELRRLRDYAMRTLREQPRSMDVTERQTELEKRLGVGPFKKGAVHGEEYWQESAKADLALADFLDVVDDIRAGVFFADKKSGVSRKATGAASSTLTELMRRGEAALGRLVDSVLRSASLKRRNDGKMPLSTAEALKVAKELRLGEANDGLERILLNAVKYEEKMKHDRAQIAALRARIEKYTEQGQTKNAATLQRLLDKKEDLLSRRSTVVNAGMFKAGTHGAQRRDMRIERLERRLQEAQEAGVHQERLNKLFAELKFERERDVVLGVSAEERKAWEDFLARVRKDAETAPDRSRVVQAPFQLERQDPVRAEQVERRERGEGEPRLSLEMRHLRTLTSGRIEQALMDRDLPPELRDTLRRIKDVADQNRGSRALMERALEQVDRIRANIDRPPVLNKDPALRGRTTGPVVPALQEELDKELATEEAIRRPGESPEQPSLFSEKELPGTALVRSTAAAFRKFLASKEATRMRYAGSSEATKRKMRAQEQVEQHKKLLEEIEKDLRDEVNVEAREMTTALDALKQLRKSLRELLRFEPAHSVVANLKRDAQALLDSGVDATRALKDAARMEAMVSSPEAAASSVKRTAFRTWKEGVAALPDLSASTEELERSQADLDALRQKVKDIVAIADSVEANRTLYAKSAEVYKKVMSAASRAIDHHKEYYAAQRKGQKLLQQEVERSVLLMKPASVFAAEKALDAERAAMAQLAREFQDRLDTRFGLPYTEVTAQRRVVKNRKTGEDAYAPVRSVKTRRQEGAAISSIYSGGPEAPAQDVIRRSKVSNVTVEPARVVQRPDLSKERADAYRRLKAELAATDKPLAAALGRQEVVARRAAAATKARDNFLAQAKRYDAAKKPRPSKFEAAWALSAQRATTRAEEKTKADAAVDALQKQRAALAERIAAMEAKYSPDELWSPQRAKASASKKAAQEAMDTLRKYGDVPEKRLVSTPLRAPSADAKAAKAAAQAKASTQRTATNRASRRLREASDTELTAWALQDTGIDIIKPDDGGTALRRVKGSGGIDLAQAKGMVAATNAALPKGVSITAYDSLADAPEDVRAYVQKAVGRGDAKDTALGAVLPDGRVVVFLSEHSSPEQLRTTITHELVGHYGPDVVLGPEGFKALSDQLWSGGEAGVRAVARELGIEAHVDGILAGERALAEWLKANPQGDVKTAPDAAKLAVTRELVAVASETNKLPKEPSTGLQRLLKSIVAAFRKALEKMGLLDPNVRTTSQKIFDVLRASHQMFKQAEVGPYRSPAARAALRKQEYIPGVTPLADQILGDQKKVDKSKWKWFTLAFNTQVFDSAAAVSSRVLEGYSAKYAAPDATRKWAQVMTWIRAVSDMNNHLGDWLSHGAKSIVTERDAKGNLTHTYGAKDGKRSSPSGRDVMRALGAVDPDPDKAERIGSVYGIVRRANRVGEKKIAVEMFEDDAERAKFYANKREFETWLKNNPDKKAALEHWFDTYQKYNNGLLDLLADTDALPQALVDELKQKKDYIPYYRVDPNNADVMQMFMGEEWTSFADLTHQPELRELIGGDAKIMPFYSSMIKNTYVILDKALRNKASKEAAAAFIELGLTDGGVHDGHQKSGNHVIQFNMQPRKDETDMRTAGQRHIVLKKTDGDINPNLLVYGLRGTSMHMPAVIRMLGAPGALLRKFIMRSPMYAVRQLYSDVPSLLFTSGADANLTKVLGNLRKTMLGDGTPEATRLHEMGLAGGNLYTGTAEDMERISRSLASEGKTFSWAKGMAALDKMGMNADMFSRAHIYQSLRGKGMSEMEAAMATREALDFTRRGVSPSMRMMSTLIPFFNTQVQSLYSIARALRGTMPFEQRLQLRQKFWQRGMLLAGLTMAYALSMQDDEAYKNATPQERLQYWFVPMGWAGFNEPLRIRIPFEAGLLFKAIPEAMLRQAVSDETAGEALKGLRTLAMNSVPFLSMPPVFKAGVEQLFNVNTFTQRQLEDSAMQRVDPSQRYRSNTTETAKAIGAATGISPVRLENLITNFTSGTGLALVSLGDLFLRAMGEVQSGPVQGRASKMPVIGSAFQPHDSVGLVNSAYDMAKEFEQRAQTFKKLSETPGRRKEAEAYAKEYAKQIAFGSRGGAAPAFTKEMADLKRRERLIYEAPESVLPPERKRKMLDMLRQRQIEVASGFRTAALRAGT